MKKILTISLALLMALVTFTACGGQSSGSGASDVSVDSLKTFGDIFDANPEELQTAVYEDVAIIAFKLGDTYYRGRATVTHEFSDEFFNMEMTDDWEKEQHEFLAPVEIESMENLTEQIPPQEELDKLIGKTGQDLMDDGWIFSGYNLEDMVFWMNKGPFQYNVVMEGEVAESEWETFEAEEKAKDLIVKSVEFNTIGDATNIEEE